MKNEKPKSSLSDRLQVQVPNRNSNPSIRPLQQALFLKQEELRKISEAAERCQREILNLAKRKEIILNDIQGLKNTLKELNGK